MGIGGGMFWGGVIVLVTFLLIQLLFKATDHHKYYECTHENCDIRISSVNAHLLRMAVTNHVEFHQRQDAEDYDGD